MDPKLLLSYPRPSLPALSSHTLPFRSFPNPSSTKCAFSRRTHLSFPPKPPEKTQFLGESSIFYEKMMVLGGKENTHFHPFHIVRAVVKRRKEMPFDNVIQRDKKLKLVLKLRRILVSQPDRIMNLRDLGKYRRDLGLTQKRRFIALLKRFPAVFEIVEEGVYSLKFKLTPEAEQIYLEELKVRNEMEGMLVVKLRKLLMMSLEKRILLEKIAHLKTDLGLPLEFKSTICERYPQYFRVVRTDQGPALELMHWDSELAVSAAEISEEENRVREIEERNLIFDRPPRFKRVKLPKGLTVSKGEMRRICQFREMPYISPYSDFSELKAGTPEKEKHACAVVHEILSLTVEKRTLVDHFTHFREEFRFSQQLRGMLIRHPDMFYVSLKGDRDSVFLREAYRDSNLVEKDKLLLLKEKLRVLVAVPRFGRRGMKSSNADDAEGHGSDNFVEGSEAEDDDDEEWSDDAKGNVVLDGMSDEFDEDDDDEGEDDWSDEDDETPPDFDVGGSLTFERGKTRKGFYSSSQIDKVPVLPDGRPRERW